MKFRKNMKNMELTMEQHHKIWIICAGLCNLYSQQLRKLLISYFLIKGNFFQILFEILKISWNFKKIQSIPLLAIPPHQNYKLHCKTRKFITENE